MKRVRFVIAAMLLALAGSPASVRAQQPAAAPPGPSSDTLEKGKQHLVTYACSACHGYAGQGSETGPRINTNRLTLPAFVSYVRKPGRRMPPYRTQIQISDAALADIYAFLKSLPPPPDPKSIPLLRVD